MTKNVLSAVACAVALAGCVHSPHGYFRAPDPERPQVTLAGDYLVVNQEPVVAVRRGGGPAQVTWRLPPEGPLTFAEKDGIRVLGRIKDAKLNRLERRDERERDQIVCARGDESPLQKRADKQANPRAFTCVFPEGLTRGLYEYELNVEDGPRKIKGDPTVMI